MRGTPWQGPVPEAFPVLEEGGGWEGEGGRGGGVGRGTIFQTISKTMARWHKPQRYRCPPVWFKQFVILGSVGVGV